MSQLNTVSLAAAVLLQLFLVGLLFRRDLATRVPVLVALLSFYVLRAVVLACTATHVSRGSYSMLEAAFALGDVLLEVCLAVTLYVGVISSSQSADEPARLRNRLFLLPAAMVVASPCTAVLAWGTRAYSPSPVDRGVLLCGFLFVSLYLSTLSWVKPGFEYLLLRDFAFLGAVAIASQVGRALAASHRESGLYLFWAYLNAAVWLSMLAGWALRFWRWGRPSLHSLDTLPSPRQHARRLGEALP